MNVFVSMDRATYITYLMRSTVHRLFLGARSSTINVLSLRGEGDVLVVRIKHLGMGPISGSITVDTDYPLQRGQHLESVEPVAFNLDSGRTEDVPVKLTSQLIDEELYKVTITSDDLLFKKIVYHGYLNIP